MPVPVPVPGAKPKVLFICHSSGSPAHDAKIRELAECHYIDGMSYEDSVPVIADMVREHGPFDAFAVSQGFLRA